MTCDFTTKEKSIARKFIGLYLEDEYLITAYKDNDGTYIVHGYKRNGEAEEDPCLTDEIQTSRASQKERASDDERRCNS